MEACGYTNITTLDINFTTPNAAAISGNQTPTDYKSPRSLQNATRTITITRARLASKASGQRFNY
jgi:hypothetical protein